MIVASGKKTDTVFRAGRKHRMGEQNFSMVKHNYGDVLERYERRCLLLNSQRKMLALEFSRL